MKAACQSFRDALERLRAEGEELARLAADPHARASAPTGAAAVRGEVARDERLDGLLARWSLPAAPAGLARRVLAGVEPERARDPVSGDAEIDDLLERDAGIRTPAGLSARVLAGLAAERPALRPASPRRFRRAVLVAAAVALVFAARYAWRSGERQEALLAPRAPETAESAGTDTESEELLVYALERWDLLHDDDLDVWLASLDPVDEMLVELADGGNEATEGRGNGQGN